MDKAVDEQPDPPAPMKRTTRRGKLRIKTEGSCRAAGWGVNFGPDSDVDAEIPGSGGLTLRKLKDAGEIREDCFHSGDEE